LAAGTSCRWGSLSAPPAALAAKRGPTSKGREGKGIGGERTGGERRGQERRGVGREGRVNEERKGMERGRVPLTQIYGSAPGA